MPWPLGCKSVCSITLLLVCLELKPNSIRLSHHPSWVCPGIVIGPSEDRIYSKRHEIENNDPNFHCCWNDNSSCPNWVEHLHKYCGRIPCQLSVKSDSHTLRTTIFASPDKKVTLEISTHPNSLQKHLQDFFHEDVARRTEGGDEINYSVLKNGWFVVSGTNAKGFEFYEKFFLFDEWWINFDFVYPSAQRATYDPMVAKIAKYFVPNLPGEHEH